MQLSPRFDKLESFLFLEILDSSKFNIYNSNFPEELIVSLNKSEYAELFDFAKLKNELLVLHFSDDVGRYFKAHSLA